MLRPCERCPITNQINGHHPNEKGELYKLCATHAYELGLLLKPVSGCSRVACEVWDRLELEMGIKLQHAHFSFTRKPSVLDEHKVLKYRVDAFDSKNKIIYEFLGTHCHGFPPEHSKFYHFSSFTNESNATMYFKTMERMNIIANRSGLQVKFIWSHKYDKVKKTAHSLKPIIHSLDKTIY